MQPLRPLRTAVVAVEMILLLLNHATGQTVRFFEKSVNVEEGEEFTVRVELLGSITEDARVIVEITNDNGKDFVGDTQVATFTPSSSVAEVTFTAYDDQEPENKELFYLKLSVLNSGLRLASPHTIPVIIEANDDAFGVFGFKEVSPVLVEEKELITPVVSLRIQRTVSYYSTVYITYEVNSTSETALLGTDIAPRTGSITFLPNQREALLQLEIKPDSVPEDDESFIVSLTYTNNNARINESEAEVTVTIKANDAPVRFTQESIAFEEGPGTKVWNVEVTRGIVDGNQTIGPLDKKVVTRYRFEAVSATSGDDFSSDDGELVFEPEETRKTIGFIINDDAAPEVKETFKIRLLILTGDAVYVNPNVIEITISANDNPSGLITFAPPGENSGESPVIKVNEDTYTEAVFSVLRKEGTYGNVSVGWIVRRTSDGVNEAPTSQDVGPVSGRLSFSEGEREKQIKLLIVQDIFPEAAEEFEVILQRDSLTGDADVRGISVAKLLIEDSDNVYGSVEFDRDTSHTIDVNSNPRYLKLSVTRNGGRFEDVFVNITVSYSDNGIQALPENIFEEWTVTATLLAGQNPTVVDIALLSSAFLTIGGHFVATMEDVRLSSEPRYGAYNSPTLGLRQQITIAVSEREANGESGFNNTAPIQVDEPETGALEIPLLIIREGRSGTAAIRWSVSGVDQSVDSVDDKDVAVQAGTININFDSTSVILYIKILADDVPEIDETMVVQLESIQPYTTQRLRPGSTKIFITVQENDNPGGEFQFSPVMQNSYTITEGVDPIEVVVERIGGALVSRSVQFEVFPDGAKDFFGTPTALQFGPGIRTRKATVLARNEGEPELAEYFQLRLIPLGNSTLSSNTSTINITVLESDFPYGRIQFKEDPTIIFTPETIEGKPVSISLAIQRDRGTFTEVTVPWSLSPATASDLQPSNGTIVFQPGQSDYTLILNIVNDNVSEGDETYAVQLSKPTGGAVLGVPVVAKITITENDNPIVFTETLVYVDEPGSHQFTVQRSGKLNKAVSASYRTLDGSASALDGDYTEIFKGTLNFAPNEATKTLTVTVLNDFIPEGNETFTVELFDVSADMLVTPNSRATVMIIANDDAYGVFSFETPTNNHVEEGSTIYFNVIREKGTFGEVEVFWEIQTQLKAPLAPGSEFQTTQGSMVFKAQEARLPLAITPLADQMPEGQETFSVVLIAVKVVRGLANRALARLAVSNTQTDVVVLSSDDPSGRFAFPTSSQELSVAEDFYVGSISSTMATFTVDRRQGTEGTVKVLWEIFAEPFGTNLPVVYDLLFIGQVPKTMSSVPSKQRSGTGTIVYSFSGASDSHVTIPTTLAPTLADTSTTGFSISAWVQPSPLCNGYIIARSKADGTSHYYSLRLITTATTTTLDMTIASSTSQSNYISPAVSGVVVQDGHWHHVVVAVTNTSCLFYLDGKLIRSSAISSSVPPSGDGILLVGGRAPGSDHFVGYMQDVRIWARTLTPVEAESLYEAPPLKEVTPMSGVLTYNPGVRTGSFTVKSKQDIEEEGDEVFSVTLVASTGGATLSVADSRTTLTVLKSDNANGLFGFREPCSPARVNSETASVRCNVVRERGDDGTVTVTWLVQQRTAKGLSSANADFNNSTGSLVFLRGERLKSLEIQVTEETLPELDELFEISLVSAVSDDNLVGSTNTSGASINPTKQSSLVTIVANDYPYGLLQFGKKVGLPPTPGADGMILPATKVPTVSVSEEGGVVPLVIERAQGTLGAVSVEWRTIDKTALSEGKIPPDYVGAAGRLDFKAGELYTFVNITVKDNSAPEGEKTFQVELINPTGGAAISTHSSVLVTINASDNAFGVYQFADESLTVMAIETGDVGYTSVGLKVVRLGGTIGADAVSWTATENLDDGQDLTEISGILPFAAGQSTANLEIRVRGDSQPELDEMVNVTLTKAIQGTLGDVLKRSSIITIQANDDPYGYFVIVNLQRPVRVEEAVQRVGITIRRRYGTFGSVNIGYKTLAPSETYNFLPVMNKRADNLDFTSVSGNVTFTREQTFGTFFVPILDDTEPEQDESVFVLLTGAFLVQAAQTRVGPNEMFDSHITVSVSPRLGLSSEIYGQIIISSNDDAGGVLQLSPTSLTVAENTSVPQLMVVRSGGTFGEVIVQIRAISGEAQNELDFSLLSRQVVLNSGETRKLIPLSIYDDPSPELNETFTVELLDQITGGARLGTNRSAVITIEPSDDPNGVFVFASTGRSVQEPENGLPYSVNITVVRTGGSIDVVNLQWTATLNGASLTTDISPTSGSVFFVSNEASRPITVSILPDDDPEGSENIIITLLSASNGGRIGDQKTFQLTIVPNDSPHGYIQFASPAYTVQEGPVGPQYLQLTRSGGTYARLRVYYSTRAVDMLSEAIQDGSTVISYFSEPASGKHPQPGTAVNVSGATDQLLACSSACLTMEACQSFQFGRLTSGVMCTWFTSHFDATVLIPAANFSIYNKDTKKVKSVFARLARPGEDYSTLTGSSMLIPDGNITGQLPVTILDDNIPELNEKFSVVLLRVAVDDPTAVTHPDTPHIGADATATVTIAVNDNAHGAFKIYSDSPTADPEQKTVSFTEQDKRAVDLIVEREGGSIGEVTVAWQVISEGRTATYGVDFIADGATLTFTSGLTRKIVTVTILDDTVPEEDEQFTIQLINPGGGATLGSDSSVTIIILANDNVAGVLAFNTTSVLAAEGDQISLEVIRNQATRGTVKVNWVIEGLNGLQPQLGFKNFTGALTFLNGESRKTITLTVLSDNMPEINEEYLLKLSGITTEGVGATGAAIISPQYGTASITIKSSNNPHGILQFAATSLAFSTTEDAGSVSLQVDRKFGSIGIVRLSYQVVQGANSPLSANLALASPGQDFTGVINSFIDIPSSATSATITVKIINDQLPEVDEVFLVMLTSVTLVGSVDPTSAPQLATNGTKAEVKIGANDGAQGVIVFAADSRNVSVEEVSPSVSLKVLRTEGTFGAVSVMYYSQNITENTGNGADYRIVPGDITFAAGEREKSILIEIINDNNPEPNEQFEVVLTSPRDGASLGQFIRATVTIQANDGSAGIVTIVAPTQIELQEPRGDNYTGSKAEFSVHRGPGIFGQVTVPFVITNLFDIPSSDVTPASGVVIFEDRQATAVIEVTAVDDSYPETAEEFVLKLQQPSNGATLGAETTATVLVQPSDSPYGLFDIFPAGVRTSSVDVEETVSTIKLDVVRSKGLLGRVSVDVTTNSDTATFASSSTNIVLAEFQSIPAARVSAWHAIKTVANTTYVLMLTSLNSNEQLRSLLPESSRGIGAGQSVLYRWQGELVYIRTLDTDGATAADSFNMGGQSYFIIVNSGKEGARKVQSHLYRLDADGSVEVVQGLTTYGATDIKHFMSSGQLFLAIANSLDDSSSSNIKSFIYMWNSDTQKFSVSPTQQVPSLYAKAVEVFTISDVIYMVIANFYNRVSGSYEIDSVVYRQDKDKSFVEDQRLGTKGATDICHFMISGKHYLAVANNRQDIIKSPQTSNLYRWDASTGQFLLHQELSTTRVAAINAFTMQDGTVFLAIANSVGASDILLWNVSQSRFVSAWTGDPYLLLQPFTIQQPAGSLHLLAAAHVETDKDGKLMQVARITDQSDFVQRRITMTFEPAQMELHTTVVILADDKPEDLESFSVDIVDPSSGAEVGMHSSVTVNILSNDNAHGIIQFSTASVNVIAEEKDGRDNPILLNVERGDGHFGDVSVRWEATGDQSSLDISPLSGTLEFRDGYSVATITLTIKDDNIAEFAEKTYVRLKQIVNAGSTLPSKGAKFGERLQATVTVLANDSPYGVVYWENTEVVTPEPEGTDGTITLNIIRDQGLQGQLRIDYVTSMAVQLPPQQQATSGEDFVQTQQFVMIAANARNASVQITIKQDDIPEASETFFVNLTDVKLIGMGGENSARPSIKEPGNVANVTILENDNARGTVQFDVETNIEGRVDVYEEYGRNATVTLTLRRYIGLLGSLVVSWQAISTSHVSASFDDYYPIHGSVKFEDGQETAAIIISIVDDQLEESMESFDVKLIQVSGDAMLGNVTSVRIAILKNDSPTGLFRFMTRKVEIRESLTAGDSMGQAQLTIQRVQGTQGVVNVRWRLNAAARLDFIPPLEGTLRFEQGQTEEILTLQSQQDGVLEGRETFVVSLVSADNNADISPKEGDAMIVILADPGASGTISIVRASRSVAIGEPGEYNPAYDGTAHVELIRSRGIYGEVVVTWAIVPRDVTAFMQVEGSVTFSDQQKSANITLQARDDSKPELRTSFTLDLTSASGGAAISTEQGSAQCNVVFVASDYPHGLFEFSMPETLSVSEDQTEVLTTVLRTKGHEGYVRVHYTTTAGTATSDEDFVPVQGVLMFQSGITSQLLSVPLRPDDVPEGPEIFFVNLTSVQLQSPSNNDYTEMNGLQPDMAPALGGLAVKTVIIQKNDNAEGIIEFEKTAISVQEEMGVAGISVVRQKGSYGNISVVYQTQAMTASSGVDYQSAVGTLELKEGQDKALINVTLVDDNEREFEEKFSITLSDPKGGALLGYDRTAVITIVKSDYPNGKFSFVGATELSVPNLKKAQSQVFSIERSEGLLGKQQVFWRIMGPNNPNLVLSDIGDISHSVDGIETTSGDLTWGDGEGLQKQFTLTIKPHLIWEIAKTFVINIYDIQGTPATVGDGEASPTAGNISLTVQKHGDPNGIIQFKEASTTVREFAEPSGSELQQVLFPVGRKNGTGITGVIKIHWDVRGPERNNNQVMDIQPQNGTLLLENGQRDGMITLQILPDDIPELEEEFSLVITHVEGGAGLDIAASVARFRIRYNDNPHGVFGIVSTNQEVVVNPGDLARSLALNFTRYKGTFGSVILTYRIIYNVPESDVGVSESTGTVTFTNNQRNSLKSVSLKGDDFVELDSTFSVSLLEVNFNGDGVTEPPQLKLGETEAQVRVPSMAANSEVSFLKTIVNVNYVNDSATFTVVRRGVYGTITVDWTSGQVAASLPSGVTNGQITPSQGSVNIGHGVESMNITVKVMAKLGQAEVFMVRLPRVPETPVSGGARLAPNSRTAIFDPAGVVRFMPASLTPQVSEPDKQVTVEVCRAFGVSDRIEVTYSTEDITAYGDYDYHTVVFPGEMVTMEPGQATATISIQIFEDNIPEKSELFSIILKEVNELPTPLQPVPTPRLAPLFTVSTVNITESNDPYGVLWFKTDAITHSEGVVSVPLTIKRSGGLFGQVSVKVRTVGGGESWTDDIVPSTDFSKEDTIAQALGQRNSTNIAKEGLDYDLLDTTIIFEGAESERSVEVKLLDDDTPEPMETVLIYLTNPEGGARIATGTPGKGYAEITILKSDNSQGYIGFAENSTSIHVNEDLNPTITLTLTRLMAFYGTVRVTWKAKLSRTSSQTEDFQLFNQLQAISGETLCPPDTSLCNMQVKLINDSTAEESFDFVVKLVSVEEDAKLIEDRVYANVTVLPSDYARGLLQFIPSSRMVVVRSDATEVKVGVERIQGLHYDIILGFTTLMSGNTQYSGIQISPALEGMDFTKQQGTLEFKRGSQAIQYIKVLLTPSKASDNPFPKQFFVNIFNPSNGASVNEDYSQSVVRIVRAGEEDVWTTVLKQGDKHLNDTNIRSVLNDLDKEAQDPLTDNEVTVIDDMVMKINEEGAKRKLPEDVLQKMLDLLCKMLEPSKLDATRGQHQLSERVEELSYIMLTDQPCPAPTVDTMKTKSCSYIKVSSGKWSLNNLKGLHYDAQNKDLFLVPSQLTVSNTADQCAQFHMIEYSSTQWFPKDNKEKLLSDRVLAFGIKEEKTGRISDPVRFRIHTKDNRIAPRKSKCVYFDSALEKWVGSEDVCDVENNLNLGTDDYVDCACSHMSNYAVVAEVYDGGYTVWFYVACSVCMSSMILVILVHHLCHGKPTFASSLMQHMFFAILLAQLCLLLDAILSPKEILVASARLDNYRCIVMAVFLHYFFLAQFMWIMVQSINLWKVLVMNDERTERNFLAFFLLGWGLPLIYVALFYAVTFNIYKYQSDLPVDFIYGDVRNNGEICFLTNAYAAVGGIIVPVLLILLLSGIVFIKAFQLVPQWQAYDDIYRGRYNFTEVRLLLLLWSLLVLTWLWGGLHVAYGQRWMLVLFCICDTLLGLLAIVLYAVLRNPCLMVCIPAKKTFYTTNQNTDVGTLPPSALTYHHTNQLGASNNTINTLKGSRTSLINDAWERGTVGSRSLMTVKRALPSQVYINPPPIAIVSPAATTDLDPQDFDELLYTLKMGQSYTPSELSRSIADDDSQLSTKLDRYETKRIDIADTHL